MTSSKSIKKIFINENENIFEALSDQEESIVFNPSIKKHLKFISNKKGNNYIGYYQFLNNNVYYKIYILPKTFPRVENTKLNQDNFITLLKTYYRLKVEYKFDVKHIDKNIIDFAIENNKDSANSDEVEQFIHYQYLDAIGTIKAFFKKHNQSITKELKFSSQNIKNRLDLKRNISELDKSKIHQSKKIPYLYSKYAIITNEVLKYFLKNKCDEHYPKSKREAKKVKAKIISKYLNNKGYTFKVKEIISKKVIKLFKTKEEKDLQRALMQLLGVENYFEDKNSKDILSLHNQHALFFRPEKLFEWVVYDSLVKKYIESEIEVQKIYKYKLAGINRDSKPDFIVHHENEIIVIDAKWKILESLSQISFSDIAKLRRDMTLAKATKAILIYPHISFEERDVALNVMNEQFKFELDMIDINEE